MSDDGIGFIGSYVTGSAQSGFAGHGFIAYQRPQEDGEIGLAYCQPTQANSTGQAGALRALGSVTAVDNQLVLEASQIPAMAFGLLISSPLQGFVSQPGGSQGNLCLGGPIGRFNSIASQANSAGVLIQKTDLTQMPTPLAPAVVMVGQTWNYQVWFRDNNPAATSNFTNGVTVSFQ
ncbi:MAG: hypothetical protein P1V35_07590 [Planctomycetota bacterium]|nr:hypothetical protein [Planctomycetota bacterium]